MGMNGEGIRAVRDSNLNCFLDFLGLGFGPPVEGLAESPEGNHGAGGAEGVDEDVGEMRSAGRDVDLMEFVGGGVEEDDEDGSEGFIPAPGAEVVADRFAKGAPEEKREHGIFREVGAFAEQEVNGLDVFFCHVREEPVEKRHDDS